MKSENRASAELPPRQVPWGTPIQPEPLSRRSAIKKWAKRSATILLVLLLITLLFAVYVGWQFFDSTTRVFGGSPLGNAVQAFAPSNLDSDSRGRTNILIAGNSVDDPGHEGADLTDSIMVLSVDAADNKAYLISIPRDLLVRLPDHGYNKINAAYSLGGIELLEDTISSNLRLQIHYHTLVNYTAVRDTVNAVGGIDVTIQSSDPRGLYDPNIQVAEGGPLRLGNSTHHLDGQTALNLARARGNPAPDGRVGYGFARGDFDRSAHQQLILAALKDKVTDRETMFNPYKLGNIFEAVGNNIRTDMQINEARRIATLLQGLDQGGLQNVFLSSEQNPLLTNYTTRDGQAALIPIEGIDDFSEIQRYLQNL